MRVGARVLMNGHVAVIDIRMEVLAGAIRSRDWEQVEFQYDRVLHAVSKLKQELPSARQLVECPLCPPGMARIDCPGHALEDHSVALRRATDAGVG